MPPRWKKNHNMKSWTIIKILILVNCLRFASTQSCPGGQRARREFRDMTVQEWAEFRTGILRLQQDGTWARLANQHGQFLRTAHDGGQFLPWHREYLLRVENELIRVNPNIRGLPYWNSAADSNAPHRSPLWTQNYLGGSTVSNNRPTCIPNGPFASFRRPDGRCITRGFSVAEGFTTNENGRVNMRLNSWQELMGFVDRYPTFGEFAYFLENFAHNYPHLWVGGYLGTMSLISDSAFDVAFILHHAFFDYIYHIWQQRHGFDTYQET
ncbi:hypothetical protein BKA69DRAFT_375225 [Paraphysoderma sedebokerense]|nr:hypothetical protein BKA69DRAFT_375225 [Paraphysoderma sedebokerense]